MQEAEVASEIEARNLPVPVLKPGLCMLMMGESRATAEMQRVAGSHGCDRASDCVPWALLFQPGSKDRDRSRSRLRDRGSGVEESPPDLNITFFFQVHVVVIVTWLYTAGLGCSLWVGVAYLLSFSKRWTGPPPQIPQPSRQQRPRPGSG